MHNPASFYRGETPRVKSPGGRAGLGGLPAPGTAGGEGFMVIGERLSRGATCGM